MVSYHIKGMQFLNAKQHEFPVHMKLVYCHTSNIYEKLNSEMFITHILSVNQISFICQFI